MNKQQKDALVRRVQKIVDQKRKAKIEELKKSWKPDAETKKNLAKLEKAMNALGAAFLALTDAGCESSYLANFMLNWAEGKTLDNSYTSTYKVYFGKSDTYADVVDRIKEAQVSKLIDTELYPGYSDIEDELELNTLSKSFDIDEFLKKYENL